MLCEGVGIKQGTTALAGGVQARTPDLSAAAAKARNGCSAHRWFISNQSIQGEYGGKEGKVFPAICLNPGCKATTSFPVHPEQFKDTVARGMPSSSRAPDHAGMQGLAASESLRKEEHMPTGRGGGAANIARSRFYDEHKSEILLDLQTLKKPDVLKKWSIPLSTWKKLRKKWCIPSNGHNGSNGMQGSNGSNGNGHHLPANGNGHGTESVLAQTLQSIGLQDDSRARLATLLRRMAETEGTSELARGLRLAATLVEAA